MISIGRVQVIIFTLAMVGLIGITLCVYLDLDEFALWFGFVSGWFIGVSQATNNIIIDISEKATKPHRSRYSPKCLNAIIGPKTD